MFHYTTETGLGVRDAVSALEAALQEEKFAVLWTFSIRERLREKGFDCSREFIVLEVCSPEKASRVMETNFMAGYFMPCKIVVYEADGGTRIGLPKPTVFMELMGDAELANIADEVERKLIGCVDRVCAEAGGHNR